MIKNCRLRTKAFILDNFILIQEIMKISRMQVNLIIFFCIKSDYKVFIRRFFKTPHSFQDQFFPFNIISTVEAIIHRYDIKSMNYGTLLSLLLWITTFGQMGLISIIRAIHVIYKYIIVCHNLMQFILIREVLLHSSYRPNFKFIQEAIHSHGRLSFFEKQLLHFYLTKYFIFLLLSLNLSKSTPLNLRLKL